MVTKNQTAAKKRGKIKVGELKLNKETVRDLSKQERKDIKGGQLSLSRAADGCVSVFTCVLAK